MRGNVARLGGNGSGGIGVVVVLLLLVGGARSEAWCCQ